ncbi:hypothetical protein L227DRAFT_436856 [Lentinus tigrinus ALCF2SS1-6]|uniref:Uncharacterized protein n=1 Tax=Lentinus tigrinus ALCF2SS1-6 TaxID=1328759 RepID=A0A5C2SHM4_9APHY|nr:hypothetical protein L227DRAFT_436856 [Lentinus tigrinus ALCF2SS1-6]
MCCSAYVSTSSPAPGHSNREGFQVLLPPSEADVQRSALNIQYSTHIIRRWRQARGVVQRLESHAAICVKRHEDAHGHGPVATSAIGCLSSHSDTDTCARAWCMIHIHLGAEAGGQRALPRGESHDAYGLVQLHVHVPRRPDASPLRLGEGVLSFSAEY